MIHKSERPGLNSPSLSLRAINLANSSNATFAGSHSAAVDPQPTPYIVSSLVKRLSRSHAMMWSTSLLISSGVRAAWVTISMRLHVHSAVDVQHRSGDVAGLFTCQESDRGGHIFGASKSLQRNVADHLVLHFLRQDRRHIGFDKSRRDGVHGYVAASHLLRQRFRPSDQSSLRRDIIRLTCIPGLAHHRRNINDASPPRFHHML